MHGRVATRGPEMIIDSSQISRLSYSKIRESQVLILYKVARTFKDRSDRSTNQPSSTYVTQKKDVCAAGSHWLALLLLLYSRGPFQRSGKRGRESFLQLLALSSLDATYVCHPPLSPPRLSRSYIAGLFLRVCVWGKGGGGGGGSHSLYRLQTTKICEPEKGPSFFLFLLCLFLSLC